MEKLSTVAEGMLNSAKQRDSSTNTQALSSTPRSADGSESGSLVVVVPPPGTVTPRSLPKGSAELCSLMEERSKTSGITGYKPYPPVTNAQVRWVKENITGVQMMAEKFDPKNDSQRKTIGMIIAKFLMLYPPVSDNRLSGDQLNAAATRQKIAAEAFVDDLAPFPAWAVQEGVVAYRQDLQGKWPPKTSGEILPYIQAAYSKCSRVLKDCRRILVADARGLNVDAMNATLEVMVDEKARAQAALEMMHALESSCEILIDPVGRELYHKCHTLFHTWRIANSKNEEEKENDAE